MTQAETGYLERIAKSGVKLESPRLVSALPSHEFGLPQFTLTGDLVYITSIPGATTSGGDDAGMIAPLEPGDYQASSGPGKTQQLPLDHTVQAPLCPGWFAQGECASGHKWAKELACGKEWCPTCGEDDSVAHNRRLSRWMPKARQMKTMGYLVITFPPPTRYKLRNKHALSHLRSLVTHYIKRNLSPRGLCRWHWFGEGGPPYHPHFNILMEAQWISPTALGKLRTYIMHSFTGSIPPTIHYEYSSEQAKMLHWLKYVTRATFHDQTWDEALAFNLYGFHNQTAFGTFKDKPLWGDAPPEAEYAHVELLEKGLCPTCGLPIKWASKPLKKIFITALEATNSARAVGAGYWKIDSG